jgi:hypothetical protein
MTGIVAVAGAGSEDQYPKPHTVAGPTISGQRR